MQSSNAPIKFALPFANAGVKNVIPVPSQIAITPGAASLTDGFPPLTMTAVGAGGVPPLGPDFNGILYELSAGIQWIQAGGFAAYDATLSASIGGYPINAVVQSADGLSWWRSTVENNTANPNTGGAGWVPHFGYGIASIAAAGSNVTLTAVQSARPIITITGALTANIQLIFPAIVGQWIVANKTTGSYTITCKTAGGAGVVAAAGSSQIWCDASNVYAAGVSPGSFSSAQSLTTTGYQSLPGGLIMMWGTYSFDVVGDGTLAAVTFPTMAGAGASGFPSACLNVQISTMNSANDQSADGTMELQSMSATGFVANNQWFGGGTGNKTSHGFTWFALGY